MLARPRASQHVVSLDWCYASGKALGGGLLCNFTNEDNVLIASVRTKTERMEELIPTMLAIAAKPGYSATIGVIDKVPPSLDESAISKLETLICEKLGLAKVLQDRFHVHHALSQHFNNCCPVYKAYAIVGWREATVVRDAQAEAHVDAMLMAGEIEKKCGDARVVKGVPLSRDEIDQLKASGHYHDLFSRRDVVVPEHVKGAEALRLGTQQWAEVTIAGTFGPPDTNNFRSPILFNGKRFCASPEIIMKVRKKGLARMLNCIPPEGSQPWTLTDDHDHNGLPIYKPNYHTCGTESWNSTQSNFTSSACGKELATASFILGNARRIVEGKVKRGEQEDLGTWDVRDALRINRWAGHGAHENMIQLTPTPPLAVAPLPDRAPEEIVIHDIGRLDDVRKGARLVPTALMLNSLKGSPVVNGLLPPATLVAFPSLAPLHVAPAHHLLERTSEVADGEEDPLQWDSPASRARLLKQGVADPRTAPQGLLKRAVRAIEWVWGSTSADRAVIAPEAATAPAPTNAPGPAITTALELSPASLPVAAPPALNASAPVLAPLQMVGEKRRGESKQQRNKFSRSNPWWCTCQAVWPNTGGRPWHEAECPRKRYADTNGAYVPNQGTRVTVMHCAGARAGEVWECVSVSKGKWVQVREV
jgi:hypothetical protein